MTVSGSLAYPFITKDGTLNSFKTISETEFNQFQYGDIITGSYPLSATISSDYYNTSSRRKLNALKNTLNYYKVLSEHYAYSSSHGDKASQDIRILSIPSIFYGSSIHKGTVDCKFYLTGTLIAELKDENKNGELIQTGPSGSNGSGSVAGCVLYKEGFVFLTGSWSLHDSYTDNFEPGTTASISPAWKHFFTTGTLGNGVDLVPSSSFGFTFEGVQNIPSITMLAHAPRGEMNHSNNPTWIEYGQEATPFTSSTVYRERDNLSIKNIVEVDYTEETPPFEKTTYISKIGIYDEDRNLIAIAKVANPIKKKESDNFTFKMKLDM